jgi:hypothetical protein
MELHAKISELEKIVPELSDQVTVELTERQIEFAEQHAKMERESISLLKLNGEKLESRVE